MSWSLFKTKCNVLTGPQHISVTQFAQTVTDAYHQCMLLHIDSMSGGGKLVNSVPKFPILYQQFLAQCNANLASTNEINIIQQIGPMIINYWSALTITGPCGTVVITSPGQWNALPLPQNLDFQIFLNTFMMTARTHIMTLVGTYTSSVIVGMTSSWSGALFQTLP